MKPALVIAGIVLAAFAALAIRVVLEGRTALADGDAALSAKRTTDAIASWEAAARWYLPGAPHVGEAYERLIELAKSDPKHALSAWRAVRRAAIATRSLWTPHAEDLEAANAAIATLSAEHPDGATAAGANPAERTAYFASRLAAETRPSGGFAALAILGILSWLAGIGIVVHRPRLLGAAMIVGGILGWAVGLYNA